MFLNSSNTWGLTAVVKNKPTVFPCRSNPPHKKGYILTIRVLTFFCLVLLSFKFNLYLSFWFSWRPNLYLSKWHNSALNNQEKIIYYRLYTVIVVQGWRESGVWLVVTTLDLVNQTHDPLIHYNLSIHHKNAPIAIRSYKYHNNTHSQGTYKATPWRKVSLCTNVQCLWW